MYITITTSDSTAEDQLSEDHKHLLVIGLGWIASALLLIIILITIITVIKRGQRIFKKKKKGTQNKVHILICINIVFEIATLAP